MLRNRNISHLQQQHQRQHQRQHQLQLSPLSQLPHTPLSHSDANSDVDVDVDVDIDFELENHPDFPRYRTSSPSMSDFSPSLSLSSSSSVSSVSSVSSLSSLSSLSSHESGRDIPRTTSYHGDDEIPIYSPTPLQTHTHSQLQPYFSSPQPARENRFRRSLRTMKSLTTQPMRYSNHIRRARTFVKNTPILRWIEPVSLILAALFWGQLKFQTHLGIESFWASLPAVYLFSHLLRLFFSFSVLIGQELISDYRMRRAIKRVRQTPRQIKRRIKIEKNRKVSDKAAHGRRTDVLVSKQLRTRSGREDREDREDCEDYDMYIPNTSKSALLTMTSPTSGASPSEDDSQSASDYLEIMEYVQENEYNWIVSVLHRVFVQRLPFLRPLNRVVGRWDFFGVALSSLVGDLSSIPVPKFLRSPFYGLFCLLARVKRDEVALPLESYRTLQDFFTRELAPGVRTIGKSPIVSPVDGTVTSCGLLSSQQIQDVKGINYIWRDFLGDDLFSAYIPDEETYFSSMKDFSPKHPNWPSCDSTTTASPSSESGCEVRRRNQKAGLHNIYDTHSSYTHDVYFCAIRLDLGDYHRFHAPTNLSVNELSHYPGTLFPVNPLVIRFFPNHFNTNERVILSGDWHGGKCSLIAVGEYSVGSISINFDKKVRTNRVIRDYKNPNFKFGSFKGTTTEAYRFQYLRGSINFKKAAEMGMFKLGSTVVFVFQIPKDQQFIFFPKPNQRVQLGEPLGMIIPK